MALVGVLIDITRSATFAGGSYASATYQPISHSLGAQPQIAFVALQSVGSSTATPGLGILRGTGAAAGTFFACGPVINGASQPVTCVDTISWLLHSIIQ